MFLKRLFRISKIKKLLKEMPFVKPSRNGFKGSKIYWENRYLSNNNSGPGSYGRLADFKAEILNSFVKKNNIQSVIEYGCGDGNQLSLSKYADYTGYDISKKAIAICKKKFSNDLNKQFKLISPTKTIYKKAELTLSLDVLFHLIEDDIFNKYMKRLFDTSTRYVIIYSSNHEELVASHVRCREFTKWIDSNISNVWTLYQKIGNRYPIDKADPENTSFSDFYIYKKV